MTKTNQEYEKNIQFLESELRNRDNQIRYIRGKLDAYENVISKLIMGEREEYESY